MWGLARKKKSGHGLSKFATCKSHGPLELKQGGPVLDSQKDSLLPKSMDFYLKNLLKVGVLDLLGVFG